MPRQEPESGRFHAEQRVQHEPYPGVSYYQCSRRAQSALDLCGRGTKYLRLECHPSTCQDVERRVHFYVVGADAVVALDERSLGQDRQHFKGIATHVLCIYVLHPTAHLDLAHPAEEVQRIVFGGYRDLTVPQPQQSRTTHANSASARVQLLYFLSRGNRRRRRTPSFGTPPASIDATMALEASAATDLQRHTNHKTT